MNERQNVFNICHICYVILNKNIEAVKLWQDPDELFDNTKLRKYMAFLCGTKNLRHI